MQSRSIAFFLGINSRLALNLYAKRGMALDTPTLTERLASAIADGILDGTLRPGERLDELTLAHQHGVSRTPVREALRQLTTSGLIDMRPRRGAVVSQATREQIESLFVAMAEMEATCARLCALSMTPVERRRLQARQERMLALAEAGSPDAYSDANIAFHQAIIHLSGSHLMGKTIENLFVHVRAIRRMTISQEDRASRSIADHMRIIEALESRDTELAENLVRQHSLDLAAHVDKHCDFLD